MAKKMHRKLKIALWIIGGLIVAAVLAILVIFTLANRAVNSFRDEASKQLNVAVGGETTGVPVALREVWFGNVINRDYRRVDELQPGYKTLLADTKNYVAVLKVHDELVGHYNNGIKGDKPLNGDLLKTVNQYLAAVQSRFANEKDRIKALTDLSNKITSSTDFDAVSGDIDTLLHTNNDWLNVIRENLNKRITEFQKKVN